MSDLIVVVLKIAEVVIDVAVSITGRFRGSDQETDDAQRGEEPDPDE